MENYQNELFSKCMEIAEGKCKKHGAKERNFDNIAKLWSDYLEREINAKDVCVMMALLKICRIKNGYSVEDSYVDGVNYLSLAYETFREENNGKE